MVVVVLELDLAIGVLRIELALMSMVRSQLGVVMGVVVSKERRTGLRVETVLRVRDPAGTPDARTALTAMTVPSGRVRRVGPMNGSLSRSATVSSPCYKVRPYT